ncbi:plasmid partitioning protein RepA [Allorhizobium sp. NPDC080224]|uniref:Plasmid partitioning protein RepA n=2 Tax=Alphaproteobacteria TaxID=28211 RepID=A0A512HKF5_9HYPH|nr:MULTISPECIES: plasmid partitioning protein RepA [Alphaproteobacteria]HCL64094.1 plasmid partitioning protein RepA [Rhizobium sp.]NTE55315.1 plasmid partitioning protein RepA [Agrobacterium tumefaciens]NTE72781.1 plasmid partitioning protein RepA [Agrobacterium tumefaciens]GEO85929.1 plasmid partitioning protein RepA [Ciceribacter naphthalenivorans]GLR23436.1 plasmid partitioning protein RepA [Ciceribacter naphthalenivorans]
MSNLARAQISEDPADKIIRHARTLSGELQARREQMYPPNAQKQLRYFLTNEVSKLTNIPESTLRTMSIEGKGPVPARLENNHRAYTLEQINELREIFAEARPSDARRFLPRRRSGEHLQVLAVANFKGGSAKTTTSAHLAHYLALHGFRVLAIDLDPQASLSAMFGAQPEMDVGDNETIYGALRYDGDRRAMRDIIRPTYFSGIDLIPGNIEVMEYEHETPRALADRRIGTGEIFFERLRLAIAEVENDYDIVVLDTPPSLGFLTLGAIYAATGLIVTVHPAMLDVMSMSQFLLMMGDLIGVIRDAGAKMQQDFLRYLVTRHDPNDQSQVHVVGMMRSLFGDDVLTPTAVESSAVETAGLAKRTLYELEPGNIGANTVKRARESIDAVNQRIVELIERSWGRP